MNTKLYIFFFFSFLLNIQIAVGQKAAVDNNGRTTKDLAKQKKEQAIEEKAPTSIAQSRSTEEGMDKDEGQYEVGTSDGVTDHHDSEALAKQMETLQFTINQLEAELEKMKNSLGMCCGKGGNLLHETEQAYLMQNAPNPFSQSAKIQFYIPNTAVRATLQIRDLTGKILKRFEVNQRGITAVEVEGETFETGAYIYALEVDDKLVDSKIMILTK
jgi:hypothetical protein